MRTEVAVGRLREASMFSTIRAAAPRSGTSCRCSALPAASAVFGGTEVSVIHTPGHTPGSICLLVGKHLITGDTLFPNGPGHSRTPDNLRQMIASITSKLFVLPDDTRVYPGHGAGTVLGPEKQNYGVFASKPHDPNLAGDVTWTGS